MYLFSSSTIHSLLLLLFALLCDCFSSSSPSYRVHKRIRSTYSFSSSSQLLHPLLRQRFVPLIRKKNFRSSHFDPIQCLSLAQQKSTRTLVVCIRFCIFYIASLANNVSLVLGYDPLLSPQFLQSEIPGVSHSPLLGPFCPKRKNHTGENEARTGEKEKRSRM